jgi:hypothetical protein
LIRELYQLPQVFLLATQIIGVKKLAVEVVEPRQRRRRLYESFSCRGAEAQREVSAFIDQWRHG